MGVERKILEDTGLASAHDFWSGVTLWSGIATGICLVLAAIAAYKINFAIPKKAESQAADIRAALSKMPPNHWTRDMLLEAGWSELEYPQSSDLQMYQFAHGSNEIEFGSTSVILKQGEQTVLWANVFAGGHRYIWNYAEPDQKPLEPLLDGDIELSVDDAIQKIEFGELIRSASEKDKIDIVGIGLESSHGGDEDDTIRKLSRTRGALLAGAVNRKLNITDPDRQVAYYSLGLGRALTSAPRGTEKEKRQRAVVLIVAARARQDIGVIGAEEAIGDLVMNVKVGDIQLTDYEYSMAADIRLSGPLTFDGTGAPDWLDEGPTVSELVQPQQHDK